VISKFDEISKTGKIIIIFLVTLKNLAGLGELISGQKLDKLPLPHEPKGRVQVISADKIVV
jgi:hypothetical protein